MIRNHIRCHAAWRLLAVLAVLAVPAVPAAPALYDVEVIIFATDTAGNDNEDTGVPGGGGAPYAPGAYPGSEFTELSSGLYRLHHIRGGLAAARGYRVLFHRAWRQSAHDRVHAVDYPVQVSGNRGESVTGTVTLIRERYLHLDIDLRLMTPGTALPAAGGAAVQSAYRLSERRRIRSGELHYFDHPRFGVIARVTPYQAPDEPAAPGPEAEPAPQEDEPLPEDEPPV